MLQIESPAALAAETQPAVRDRHRRSRGQVIPIFAMSLFLFVGLCAIVIDVTWYWTNSLRVQRAADAAALAGAVLLPGNPSGAYSLARAEAAKNGYTDGLGGVTVTPAVDTNNMRRLNVTIHAPVGTFFMQIVGIQSVAANRQAKAEFILPVPMGSPQNYYGVGYYIKPITTINDVYTPSSANTGWKLATATPAGTPWTVNNGTLITAVNASDTNYAKTTTNGATQQWGTFGLLPTLTAEQTLAINGIEVRLTNASISPSCVGTTNKIGAALSWDGGTNWTTTVDQTGNLTTTPASTTFGSSSSLAAWAGNPWNDSSDIDNSNFRVRLTGVKGCAAGGTEIRLDRLDVRITYTITTHSTTTTYTLQPQDIVSPSGGTLAPQKFWGAMQSQGAPNIQGDAYMTYYNTRTSSTNGAYDPYNYFNYQVEIPAGSSNGSVWIFDPGFCDTTTSAALGENWTVGGANGYASRQPISAYFDLLSDPNGTPYDYLDDTVVASSGTTFRRQSGEDYPAWRAMSTTPTAGIADCSSASWHDTDSATHGWYQLATGLGPGKYRLHSYSTDPGSATDQRSSTGLNAFAFYATASGGSPRIYGLGAMEAYVRLPGGQASEFYLAQIDAVHAGKTVVINLWDPGDTGNLSANLQILQPGTLTPASFNYTATAGSNAATAGCASRSGTGVTSVTTNTGGSSLFNGCWLTIEITLPSTYTAPVDPVSGEAGWWKIRYTMGTYAANNFSTDLTTWTVNIRGNPVHLVVP